MYHVVILGGGERQREALFTLDGEKRCLRSIPGKSIRFLNSYFTLQTIRHINRSAWWPPHNIIIRLLCFPFHYTHCTPHSLCFNLILCIVQCLLFVVCYCIVYFIVCSLLYSVFSLFIAFIDFSLSVTVSLFDIASC